MIDIEIARRLAQIPSDPVEDLAAMMVRAFKAEEEVERLRHVMARALERTQVSCDTSGAADEATAILEAEVNLDGTKKVKDANA